MWPVVGNNTKLKAADVREEVDVICNYAEQHGIPSQELKRLLDLVTSPNGLDQTSRGLILKSLYPASSVPAVAVQKAASSLGYGTRKPQSAIQIALLRWLIMVHPILENHAILSSLYSVFFNMLDRMDIRAPLCYLIAMVTRRVHVKPFRLDILRRLAQSVPREPALENLLRIYEFLGSDHLDRAAAKGPPAVFPYPDSAWGNQLQAIQQRTGAASTSAGLYPRPFSFSFIQKDVTNGPEQTFGPPEQHFRSALDMTSVEGIVSRLEDLDAPSLSARHLNDHLLSQYLFLRPEEEVPSLLDDVLTPLLNGQLDAVAKGEEIRTGVLKDVLAQTRFAKACHSLMIRNLTHPLQTMSQPTLSFLQKYLSKWDGRKDQHLILDLLSYLPITPFAGTLS